MDTLYHPGLEGVVATETGLSLVDGQHGRLIFRGYKAGELAIHHSYEEIAFLLWYGKLPKQEEVCAFKQAFANKRYLPDHVKKVIDCLPKEMEMMAVIRTAISAMGTYTVWPPVVEEATRLTAILPTIITYRYRKLNDQEPVPPNENLNHTANYLYMLTGKVPQESYVKALETYLILTMEHGMNASTFAARVVASTESDLVSAITGAIGAMKGPLHGGAPSGVIDLLNEIGTKENAEAVLRQHLENGDRLMGFGHRVYKTEDPRALALKEVTSKLTGEDHWFELSKHVETLALRLLDEYKPGRRLYTNVEFYAAAVLKAVELPPELYTPTFTLSRITGWTAHVLEQADNNRIFRPQSRYIGEIHNR